jgi:hypothetical protein
MRLTRMPSFAIQATSDSSIELSHTWPSTVSHRPCSSVFGTPLWWSDTTCHELLNTGDPDDPEVVSVLYQIVLSASS